MTDQFTSRSLEAAALNANEQHDAVIDVANGWRAKIEAMREYFGALQGGFYLDGYDAMREANADAPVLSYAVARGIFAWQPGDEPAEVSVRRMRDAQGTDADLLDAIARDPAAQVLALIRRLSHAQAEDTVARAQAEVDGRAQLDDDYWSREGEQHVD